jgi:hypothetical protein
MVVVLVAVGIFALVAWMLITHEREMQGLDPD